MTQPSYPTEAQIVMVSPGQDPAQLSRSEESCEDAKNSMIEARDKMKLPKSFYKP